MVATLALPPQPDIASPQARWQWARSWEEARLAALALMHLAASANPRLQLDARHPWPNDLPTPSPTPTWEGTYMLRLGRHDALVVQEGQILPWPVQLATHFQPDTDSLRAAAQAPHWSGQIATRVADLAQGHTAAGWATITPSPAPDMAQAISSAIKALLWPSLHPYAHGNGPMIVQLYAAHVHYDGTTTPAALVLRGNAPARYNAHHGPAKLHKWTRAMADALTAHVAHLHGPHHMFGRSIGLNGPSPNILYGKSFEAKALDTPSAHEHLRARHLANAAALPSLA